jgi:hypothetical protein
LSYAAFQVSSVGESEFLLDAPQAAKIAATKKQKHKSGAAGSPFLVTFLAKEKSD